MKESVKPKWNDASELRCLIIFKQLFVEGFPRGKQIEYCRNLSKELDISAARLSARVSNFKAAAGINSECEVSAHTARLYRRHKYTSIEELEKLVAQR